MSVGVGGRDVGVSVGGTGVSVGGAAVSLGGAGVPAGAMTVAESVVTGDGAGVAVLLDTASIIWVWAVASSFEPGLQAAKYIANRMVVTRIEAGHGRNFISVHAPISSERLMLNRPG